MSDPRPGYTLPVFACASAVAALHCLQGRTGNTATLNLLDPPATAEIPIEQVARLDGDRALAITRSDPGDNLDLTRHTPVWALVQWGEFAQPDRIDLRGGEGIGRAGNAPAIYSYARHLLQANLEPLSDRPLRVTIVLPEGRRLAERTSNAAFGVVEGLSLLGTGAIAEPLSAPGQLDAFRRDLSAKVQRHESLVFCIGENGLDLARRLGIDGDRLLKTANWLGPLLVAAGAAGARELILFGYHGKLLKLAGGIFHTHHHLADGRREILTATAARCELPGPLLRELYACPTAEAGLELLRSRAVADPVYRLLAEEIDRRAAVYIRTHAERDVAVGCILFDRSRRIILGSDRGRKLLEPAC